MKQVLSSLVVFFVFMGTTAHAQLGIFDVSEDIGNADEVFGFADFIDDEGRYIIEVLTSDLDEPAPDNFHYAYNEMTGSFSIQADPFVFGGRGGVMIRKSNDDSAAHGSLLMSSDLNIWPHTRFVDGGGTINDGDPEDDTTLTVRLVRAGNSIHYMRTNIDESEQLLQSEVIQFGNEPILAGLAIGGNNGIGEFTNVSINELPINVARILPTTEYEAGMTMEGVQVVASVRDGASATATVNEIVPRGAVLSNVQVSTGEFTSSGNAINWTVGEISSDATLTYDIAFPDRTVVTFTGTFEGTDIPAVSYIGGYSVLPNTTPEFESSTDPIVIDANFPTLIQVERGTPGTVANDEMGEVDPDAFGLGLDPRTSGVIVIDTDGSSEHVIAIDVDIPETGTWYFFGLVRGDDGNSDSWHFEVDEFPSGGEDSRWNIAGNKQWGTDWVEQEDPNNDPRPFELTAGTHTLYVANREDSAMIDWLVATNNPNLNIQTYDYLTPAFFTRSADNVILTGNDPREITVEAISPESASLNMTIIETPPQGWEVSGINTSAGDASFENGQIVWDLSNAGGIEELTYTVTPPTGIIGGAFMGSGTVQGLTFDISGINSLSAELIFENIFPTSDSIEAVEVLQMQNGNLFVEAEDLPLFADGDDLGFEIIFDSEASANKFVRGGQSGSEVPPQRLVLRFEVTEPGDYAVIASSRTPTTSDDSWWLGVDETPGTDLNLYRWQGSGVIVDAFVQAWMAVDEFGPGNQQIFNFDAGVHYFQFHPREDGTDVDWFYITNDLEIDPLMFESPNAPPQTSVADFMLY